MSNNKKVEYDLKAISIHLGSVNSGHYVAAAMRNYKVIFIIFIWLVVFVWWWVNITLNRERGLKKICLHTFLLENRMIAFICFHTY